MITRLSCPGWSAWMMSAALLLAARPSLASDAPPLTLDHLTASEGMPQGTVMSTLQDSRGFVWLGTQDGLVRYDGHELFRYAYSRSVNGLPGNFIYQIVEDLNHDLWISLKDAGLARWNRATDSFTVYRHEEGKPNSLASDATRTLLLDGAGRIWVGTSGSGIDVIDQASGHIEHFKNDPSNPNSLSDDQINTLAIDHRGVVWIGTAKGLDQWEPVNHSFIHILRDKTVPGLSAGLDVSQIVEDQQGAVWIGTFDGGVTLIDRTGHVLATHRHEASTASSLNSDEVRAILVDRAGNVWVGTPEGLELFDPTVDGFTHYQHDESDASSLRDSYIMSLYQDPAGLVWIGTNAGGVSRWNPRSWELGGHRPAWLVGKPVTAFADAPEGKVWIGSVGGGLMQFDDKTGKATNFDSIIGRKDALGDQRVMALLSDRRNTLWIGTMKSGLKKYTSDGRLESVPIKLGDPRSTSTNGIMTIFESRGGDLWLGTHGGGVNVLDPKTGLIRQLAHGVNAPGAISNDSVGAIAEDAHGNIWLGTDGGGLDLASPDGTVIKVYKHDVTNLTSIPSNTIYAITVDAHGGIWIATDKGGLARVVGSTDEPDNIIFDVLSREDGLSSDTLYGVLTDAKGDVWLSGNAGLMRLEPGTRRVKTFHREHGLQGEEFDFNAYFRLHDGRICFGGPGGFNIFNPAELTDNGHAPRVALTRVEVLGVPLPSSTPYWLLDRVSVNYGASIVSLDFGALDFTSPQHNRLAYRVAGLSEHWLELGTQHRVTLTNLDAGDHLLEVRAANADSVWTDPPLKLIVHRGAAPWASAWAYSAYILIALLLFGLRVRMSRNRIAAIIRAKERLESEVSLRTRELVDSNRQLEEASRAKSSFLARMSHELRTPMNGVVGSTELLLCTAQSPAQKRLTDTIQSSSKVLLQIVNDLLDLSKMQVGKIRFEVIDLDLVQILEESATLFAAAAEVKGVELIVDPPLLNCGLAGDPLRIRQIVMNLVGNAVKFTHRGEILVKADVHMVDSSQATLELCVTDTGIGMDPPAMAKIFEPFTQADESTTRRFGGSGLGLAICKELAERMEGTITVSSTPHLGSVFRLSLPLRVEARAREPSPASPPTRLVRVLTQRPALQVALNRHLEALGYGVIAPQWDRTDAPDAGIITIVDFEHHEAFAPMGSKSGSIPDRACIILGNAAQLGELQISGQTSLVSLLHKPVHREKLREALHAIVSGGSADQGSRRASRPRVRFAGSHILLVEDEPVNATIAKGYFAELGCSSVWVVDGPEAIERSSIEQFDLIMMDINMPTMDGFATTRLIRQREGSARRIPILALTAHEAATYRERCLASGMDDVMSKPYTLQECKNLLDRWLVAPQKLMTGERSVHKARELDTASLSAIDAPTVAGLRTLQKGGLYSTLIDLFLRSSVEAMECLDAALTQRDGKAAAAVCHKLSAAAANVGALLFARVVQRLGALCAAEDLAGADVLAAELRVALPKLCEALWASRMSVSA